MNPSGPLFVTIQPQFHTTLEAFIDYWYYQTIHTSDKDKSHLYENNIQSQQLTEVPLYELYRWKERDARDRRGVFFDVISENLPVINKLKTRFSEKLFAKTFNALPAEWIFFVKHVIDPLEFPLFDKYVYTGFQLVAQGRINRVIPQKSLPDAYLDYCTFRGDLEAGISNPLYGPIQIGQVFRTFGKFVAANPDMIAYHLEDHDRG